MHKMPKYAIYVLLEDDRKKYLHPKSDGNYVVRDNIVGAAIWNSFEIATQFRDMYVPGNGNIEELRVAPEV